MLQNVTFYPYSKSNLPYHVINHENLKSYKTREENLHITLPYVQVSNGNNEYVRVYICKLRDIARSLMRTTHNAYLCKICSTGFLLPQSSFCSSFCIIWKASQVVVSTIMYCNQYYSAPRTCFYASRCIAAHAQVSFSTHA